MVNAWVELSQSLLHSFQKLLGKPGLNETTMVLPLSLVWISQLLLFPHPFEVMLQDCLTSPISPVIFTCQLVWCFLHLGFQSVYLRPLLSLSPANLVHRGAWVHTSYASQSSKPCVSRPLFYGDFMLVEKQTRNKHINIQTH